MALNTTVKWMHSGMSYAPALNGGASGLINLLTTLLVTPGATRACNKVVVEATGYAWVYTTLPHELLDDMVVNVAGSTVTVINGTKKVIKVTKYAFYIEATGGTAGTTTEAFTFVPAAAGWTRTYNTSNVAVFRPTVTSNTSYLQIDDNDYWTSLVRGWHTMTSATAGTYPFPSNSAVSFLKCVNGWSSNSPWLFVGDAHQFYLVTFPFDAYDMSSQILSFGATVAVSSKTVKYFLACGDSSGTVNDGIALWSLTADPNNTPIFLNSTQALRYGGIRGETKISMLNQFGTDKLTIPSGSADFEYTIEENNNKLLLSDLYACVGGYVYGTIPGCKFVQMNAAGLFNYLDKVTVTSTGKNYRAVITTGTPLFLLDVTGPWR